MIKTATMKNIIDRLEPYAPLIYVGALLAGIYIANYIRSLL